MLQAALLFLLVHAPGGQAIAINVAEISNLREPRDDEGSLVTPGTECLIYMNNGKFIAVVESCQNVLRQIAELEKK